MNLQEPGVLCKGRPSLVIKYSLFAGIVRQHQQCQPAHPEVPFVPSPPWSQYFQDKSCSGHKLLAKQKMTMESVSLHICQAPHEPDYIGLTYSSQLSARRLAFVSLTSPALSGGQVGECRQEGPSRESRAKMCTGFTKKTCTWEKNGLVLCLCPLFPSH